MNDSRRPVVLGLGHCCVDYLCVCAPYPEKGKKGEVIQSLTISGGPVPTALKVLAKYGLATRFCGQVGMDAAGRQILAELTQSGIDLQPVQISNQVTTPKAFIWIDPSDGSRTIALSLENFSWLEAAQIGSDMFCDCRIFLTDGRARAATLKALTLAREAGCVTVLDSGAFRAGMTELLPLIDYAAVSVDLLDSVPPEIIQRFTKNRNSTNHSQGRNPDQINRACQLSEILCGLGASQAIVTAGEHGSVWMDSEGSGVVPGFTVDLVDTTGAGDVFHGGLIFGLWHRWPLTQCLRFANAAAALSCRKLSGSLGIPELDEIYSLIEQASA